MDLSYQEKSILGSLLAMVVLYGYYFANVFHHVRQSEFNGGSIGRLIFTAVAIIAIEGRLPHRSRDGGEARAQGRTGYPD